MARVRSSVRRGMTLIEVMIAISIVMVMTTIGYASLDGAIEMNEVLAHGDATVRNARVSLSRIRRELQLAYLTPHRQAAPQYLTVFVGQDDDPDTLWFATLAHQRLYKNTRESDQAEVTIWGERAPRDMGRGDVIYHRESARIDEFPDEGGRVWPLAYNVETFNLRYLDGNTNEWFDEWDTRTAETPYRLPRAVQIALVLLEEDIEDPRDTVERPFLTTVVLEYADPIAPLFGPDLDAASRFNGAGGAGGAGAGQAAPR